MAVTQPKLWFLACKVWAFALLLLLAPVELWAQVRLLEWTPRGLTEPLILPLREGERPEAAVSRYLSGLRRAKFDMASAILAGREPWRLRVLEPGAPDGRVVTIVTLEHYLGPNPYSNYMPTLQGLLPDRGRAVLPPRPMLGLSQPERAEFAQALAAHVDLLVTPGGADITPALYGQRNRWAVHPDRAVDRDILEVTRTYLNESHGFYAGICAGCQYGCVSLGCSLHQDVVKEIPGAVNHQGGAAAGGARSVAHGVMNEAVDPASPAGRMFAGSPTLHITFSNHHQALDPRTANSRVRVVGWAQEKAAVPEMVEYLSPGGRVNGIGFQFHPELDGSRRVRQRFSEILAQEAQRSAERRSGLAGAAVAQTETRAEAGACMRAFRALSGLIPSLRF